METETKRNIIIHSQSQVDYEVRREQRNSRDYIVVPVIMMVEGVHNGSAGPILHLQQNFARNPQDWNGVPLTVGHPQNNHGDYVSALEVSDDEWVVGHVANTHVVSGKLRAEAWIDERRAIAINPEVVNYINEEKKLEVSTGSSTYDTVQNGQWNGEEYHAITERYVPDHLALLPGGQGACSWRDGCGIRNNQKEEQNEMNDSQEIKNDIKKGLGVLNGLQANETGFVELSSRIQTMLDRRDSDAQYHFLKEVYDDHFVYEVRDRDQGTQKFYRQEYAFNEGQNDIDLEGNRVEVRRNVEYLPIQSNEDGDKETSNNCGCGNSMTRTKFNTNNKQTEDSDMDDPTIKQKQPSGDVMEKVVSLVNNERTRFTKSDRVWLLQLNESQLDSLEPVEETEPETTREQALQALSEDLSDTEKLLTIVSNDIKEQVQNGISAYEDQRNKLVKAIQANTGDIWTKEKLESMDTETLQSLEKSSRKTDFSGQGTPPQNNSQEGSDDEMLLPAGVQLES